MPSPATRSPAACFVTIAADICIPDAVLYLLRHVFRESKGFFTSAKGDEPPLSPKQAIRMANAEIVTVYLRKYLRFPLGPLRQYWGIACAK